MGEIIKKIIFDSIKKLRTLILYQVSFSDHNGIKLEMYNEKNWKIQKYMKIKHTPDQTMDQTKFVCLYVYS